MLYFNAWQVYTTGIRNLINKAFIDGGEIDTNSTVWVGPDGSYAVGDSYDEEYSEYTDAGLVEEYLDD